MDLLTTYLMMNTLNGVGSTNSTYTGYTGYTGSLSQTSSALGTLSFLEILQNAQNRETENGISASSASNGSSASSGSSGSLSAGASMDAIFERAAQRYGVDVDLLKAIGKAESNFDADVVSSAGAIGVMQLMPGTARSLGVGDPYDAEQNIMGGAKYISQMLSRYDGDVELALAAYNAGPGNVDKYGGVPPFTETQNYVDRVLGYMDDELTAGNITGSLGSGSVSSSLASDASDSSAIEIEKDTLLTLLSLWRTQMELQMVSGFSSWTSDESSSSSGNLFSL